MENLQMGVLSLGKGGLFLPNSSSDSTPDRQSLFSRKPVFSVGLKAFPGRKIWDFDARKRGFGAVCALANGELEARSSAVSLLDKELKFNPTFDDYVKVMESVRIDRESSVKRSVDGYRMKRNSTKRGHKGTEEVDRSKRDVNDVSGIGVEKRKGRENAGFHGGEFAHEEREKDWDNEKDPVRNKQNGADERSSGGWGLVEEILEKRTAKRNDFTREKSDYKANAVDLRKERKHLLGIRGAGARGTENPVRLRRRKPGILNGNKDALENKSITMFTDAKRRWNDSVSGVQKFGSGDNFRAVDRKEMEICHWGIDSAKDVGEGRDLLESNKNLVHGESSARRSVVGKSDVLVHTKSATLNVDGNKIQVNIRSQGHINHPAKGTATEKLGSRVSGLYEKSAQNYRQPHAICGRVVDDDYLEERAAFKTFEVFTDINNRPRVLRMEMEEKIEKLAKWLNATDVNMSEWQFSKMMHSAKFKFTDHSILRVIQILGVLGNWKRALQVVEWLQTGQQFKSYKSRYIYTTVLAVLGKAGRPMEALNVFYRMRQELSSYPDMAGYHSIAVTLGQAGLMKELFDVIDCMRTRPEKKFKLGPLQKWDPRLEPDLVIYNAVLNACVQQKQWEGAFWVLQELKRQHLKPSNTTYGLVMEVMLACGKYNLVHEFFQKVEKTSIPSALNYKVLVNTLWKEGKADEAMLAVRDMEKRGIVGSASLYYDLARCFCSAGKCKEALTQIDKICKVAKKPLVVTYTGLIQACLDSGSVDNAAYIFEQMQKFCSPNIVTYNIMLRSYTKHGMLEAAKDLFQYILNSSHWKSNKSQAVLPDKFTFNTMIEACAEAKKWDDFEYVYGQMLHRGFYFDKKRHLRMVLDAFRAGKVEVLEKTWDHLVLTGQVPPPPIIKERFCMKLQEDKLRDAISCIDARQVIELNSSQKSWLNLLQNNVDRFRQDTVIRLERELCSFLAENQSYPVHQNLLNACREICFPCNRYGKQDRR